MPAVLFSATTVAGGMCNGMPDTCNTPTPAGPVPVPYPNVAQCNQAQKFSTKVLAVGKVPITA